MPRELLLTAHNDDGRGPRRQWYTVPLSMLTHGLLILLLVAVPLFVSDALPTPASVLVFAAPPPSPAMPPDPAVPPAMHVDATPPAADVIPVSAPDGFAPEPPPVMRVLVHGIGDGLRAVNGVMSALAAPPPVAPPPEPTAPVPVGGIIKPPAKVRDALPVYPTIAKAAHVEGTVIIQATIGKDGSVKDARVLSAPQMLDDAALTAVRQWRYTPSLLNGQPVDVLMTVTVRFALR